VTIAIRKKIYPKSLSQFKMFFSECMSCTPISIRPIWVTGGEGRGAKVTHRWAGITPAYLLPACVSCVLRPSSFCHPTPFSAAGCTPMLMLMLMVSCRRNGRKGRKSGFCVRNDFCAPHLNEGKLKWIPCSCRA